MNPTSRQLSSNFIKQATRQSYFSNPLRRYFSHRISVFLQTTTFNHKQLSTTILTSHLGSSIKPLNRQTRFKQISFSADSSKNKNFSHEQNPCTAKVNRLALTLLLASACLIIYTAVHTIHSEETKSTKPSLDELEATLRLFNEPLPKRKENDSFSLWQLKCEWFCFDAVFDACLNGQWQILDQINRRLLNNLTDRLGRSLLLAAAQEGSEECIKDLLNRNIATSRTDLEKNTPLHLATKVGRPSSIIETLCKHYANQVNAQEETALHVAVRYGQSQLISPLISNGINENAYCDFQKQRMNAIVLAVALGQIKCLDALIEHVKDPNISQVHPLGTILHIAIEYGQGKMLEHLLTKHDKQTEQLINQGNPSQGRTVLSLACEKGLSEEVEFLIKEKKARGTLPDREGKTCAHWAVIGAKNANEEDINKHLKTIEMLGYLGVDLEQKDMERLSPLEYLEKEGRVFIYLDGVINRQKKGMERPDHILFPPQNLVFQGGGPKGIAYIGFLSALKEKGLLSEVRRVAGTSAGAITAALFAVGYTPEDLKDLLLDFDLTRFLDPKPENAKLLEQVFLAAKSKEDLTAKLSPIVKHLLHESLKDLLHLSPGEGLLRRLSKLEGLCQGEEFRKWLDDRIAEKVSKITGDKIENCKYLTFGELDALIQKGYKQFKHLYIIATQINQNHKLIRFNGKDTEQVVISDAVRASMSIPGVFEPHVIYYKDKEKKRFTRNDAPKCVDGGLISNFPLNIFDNLEFQKDHVKGGGWENREIPNPRTLGVALRVIEDGQKPEEDLEVKTSMDIIKALISVYFNSEAILAISKEFNRDRIIEIPIKGVSLFDFNLSKEQKKAMIRSGKQSVIEASILKGKIENIANSTKREKLDIPSNSISNNFIERNQYNKILSTSTHSPNVYVLYGLPGMGKTQIAMNFAARNLGDFSNIWIIDCKTEGQKNQCYEEIAEKLKINSKEMDTTQLREEVHKNLANRPQGEQPWLLILDNVNQLLSREIDLPEKGGYILVTTNKKNNCPWGKPLEKVGPLSAEESLTLLEKVTLEKRSDEMFELVNSLGNFPLALNLSAQYIKTNRSTIKQFVSDYNELKGERTAPPTEEDKFYKYTLENVWDITLRGIEKDCPEALEWLTICAFLDPDQIPQSLITEWAKRKSSSEAVANKNSLRILDTLQKHHVFYKTNKKDTYAIHGLLQQVIRKKQGEAQSKNFQEAFFLLKKMGKELENSVISSPEKIKTLEHWWPIQFSHLFEDHSFIDKISNQDKTQALLALTHYTIDDLADFRSGIRFAYLGLKLNDHDPQISFLTRLGYAYGALGNYEQASQYLSQSLNRKIELFGENSPEVVEEKYKLINTQLYLFRDTQDSQQIQQAIKDLGKLLEIFKKENNGINRKAAQCHHSIGNASLELSQLEKDQTRKKELKKQSLQNHQDALTILKQLSHPQQLYHHDPDIIPISLPISALLIDSEEYLSAKEILKEIYNLQKKLNKESPNMWKIKSNLGKVYRGLALTAKTKEEKDQFLKRSQDKQLTALKIIQERVGENDYLTSFPLFELGKIDEDQNELNKSLQHFQKSYEIRKKHFKTDRHWQIQEISDAITRIQKKQHSSSSWSSYLSRLFG